ncbi:MULTISPECIES: methyltransferase domain-containing protein [unclassified Streptomyces]|uniref:methyltransferase domain-containing protein n=1 Tax=unclassified Streptomyces TaxID=2593676 RepID=UPI0037F98B5C
MCSPEQVPNVGVSCKASLDYLPNKVRKVTMFNSHSLAVGDYYDQVNDLVRAMFTDNIHYGYWEDPSTLDSLAEAGERMTEQLFARLDVNARHKVLDVGCGVGKPTAWLARKTGATVKGINVSRIQLEVADAHVRSEGLQDQVSFEVADAMHLPYPDDSFDRVWAIESMIHMPDRAQVMSEMARVLRPGGRLAIADIVVRGTLDDEEKSVAERFCVLSSAQSMEYIENYPALVKAAGLDLVELADVSEQTRPTGAVVLPSFDVLLPALGEDGVAEAKRNWIGMFDMPQYGYVLLSARKS